MFDILRSYWSTTNVSSCVVRFLATQVEKDIVHQMEGCSLRINISGELLVCFYPSSPISAALSIVSTRTSYWNINNGTTENELCRQLSAQIIPRGDIKSIPSLQCKKTREPLPHGIYQLKTLSRT